MRTKEEIETKINESYKLQKEGKRDLLRVIIEADALEWVLGEDYLDIEIIEEKYKKVFDYFGYENQRRKLNEEVQELNDEIMLYEMGEGDIKNVINEMGDVCNIIREFMFAYDISEEEITSSMNYKINRTIERINNNYYKRGE